MKLIIASNIKDLIKESQVPGYGYTDRYQDFIGRTPGDSGVGSGRGLMTNLDTHSRERVIDYDSYMRDSIKEEWGENKGVKPNGTELERKNKKKNSKSKEEKQKEKNKKKRKVLIPKGLLPKLKNKNKKDKDLGFISKFDRIVRNNPDLGGRRRDPSNWRHKSPFDKTPGAWPHNNQQLFNKLPSGEPQSWDEYQSNSVRGL